MTDGWGPASIGSVQVDDADRPYVRPVLARGVLAALVIVFAAALVLTLGLPSFG
jgi:hypothetical protein